MISIFIFYHDLKYLSHLSKDILQINNNIKLIGFSEIVSKSSIDYCNKAFPHLVIANKQSHKKLSSLLNFNYIAITIPQESELSTEKICNQINKFILDSKDFFIFNFPLKFYL